MNGHVEVLHVGEWPYGVTVCVGERTYGCTVCIDESHI